MAQEQERLQVLAGLAIRTEEFTSAEEEIAQLTLKLTNLDQKTNESVQNIDNFVLETPVSEENLGVNYKETQSKVTSAENLSQIQGLDEQMTLKSGEITTKTSYLTHLKDCAELLNHAKAEYEFLLTDFQVSVGSEGSGIHSKCEELQKKEELDREILTEAVIESQVMEKVTVKKAKNKLIEELNRTVDKAVKEVKGEVEVRGKVWEMQVKLECVGVEIGLQTLAGEAGPEFLLASTESLLRDLTSSFTSFATETETKQTAFVTAYHQAMSTEKPSILTIYKKEFEYRLEEGLKIGEKLIAEIESRQNRLIRLLQQKKGLNSELNSRIRNSTQTLLTEADLQTSRLKAACDQAAKVGLSAALVTHTPNPSDVTPQSHSTPPLKGTK